MKEQLFSFPMTPFLFHDSKNWSNTFKMKISDRNQTCPIECKTKQIWIYYELDACMRQ